MSKYRITTEFNNFWADIRVYSNTTEVSILIGGENKNELLKLSSSEAVIFASAILNAAININSNSLDK